MNSEGANWFDTLRTNTTITSSDSIWKELIKNVADQFHSKYAFFEFKQSENTYEKTNEINNNNRKNKIHNILNILNFNYNTYNVVEESNDSYSDVYGVILKLEISDETGEPQTILCKLYFKKATEDLFVPIESKDSYEIDESVIESASSSEFSGITELNNLSKADLDSIKGRSIDLICAALNNITKKDGNLGKYCFLHHKSPGEEFGDMSNGFESDVISTKLTEDERIIRNIIKNTALSEEVEVICKSIEILSIIHAKWKNATYFVTLNNTKLLKFDFGINDKVDVSCMVCSSKKPFIVFDELHYFDEEDKQISIFDEDVSSYVEKSDFSNHLIQHQCTLRNDIIHRKIVCKSMIFDAENRICKNCPYPEILYYNNDFEPVINKNLVFVSDKNDLVPNNEAKCCEICGRHFVELDNDNKCKQCNSISLEDSSDEKIYKKYSTLLPLFRRTIHIFDKKNGYEDDEVVVLRYGKKNYAIINKTNYDKTLKITYK